VINDWFQTLNPTEKGIPLMKYVERKAFDATRPAPTNSGPRHGFDGHPEGNLTVLTTANEIPHHETPLGDPLANPPSSGPAMHRPQAASAD